jgi:hypothetical protein
MRSDEELRRVLARPDLPWPDETGAYERFLRRRVRRDRVMAAAAGLVLVAMLGAAVVVARQLPQDREPAAPTTNAAELANRAAAAAAARSIPTPRPHQWVYTKSLTVEHWNRKNRKRFTHERWVRVDGRKFVDQQQHAPRAARTRKVIRERAQPPTSQWSCPPGKRDQLARVRPAVGTAAGFFPNPAVPSDPDGLLAAVYQLVEDPACVPSRGGFYGDTVEDRAFKLIGAMLYTVQPAEVRAALYRALAKIPGVTVVHGATDAAGRRGVAFARAASIEVSGSSDWLRLELILDSNSYRYLGARYVVTRDHFVPAMPSGKGTRHRKGQVLLSWAQLALAVVDAPCQRPGDPTTCASYVEVTWVGG